jgi:hypothetical protein
MNNNKRNLLLKLSVIRKFLERREINSQQTMAWRATGANNDQFIDEIRGEFKFFQFCVKKIQIFTKFCFGC